MSLSEYRRKRNFRVTSEPRGKARARRSKLSFVVQKHAASHLHYDFRLEVDGVLKSWAVPKGPSLDPSQKRLAMQVEDHPLEYGDFEGVIPQGEYGGGTVMLWDRGTWEPLADAATGLRDGHLKFTLHGEKLRGGWMLVRRGGKHATADERHWFLFKERDEFAEPGVDVATELPLSVATGRDLDAIAAQADRVWGPQGKVPQTAAKKTPAAKSKVATGAKAAGKTRPVEKANRRRKKKSALAGRGSSITSEKDADTVRQLLARPEVKPATLPRQIKPELATLVKDAPAGDEWLHEIKFDGYRMFCRIDDSSVSSSAATIRIGRASFRSWPRRPCCCRSRLHSLMERSSPWIRMARAAFSACRTSFDGRHGRAVVLRVRYIASGRPRRDRAAA